MKKIHKRILSALLSLSVAGTGTGVYLHYTGNPFDPDSYARNANWNRNQITFDDKEKNDEYLDSSKDPHDAEESMQQEQDQTAEQKSNPSRQKNAPMLFESKRELHYDVPALITQDSEGEASDQTAPVSVQQADETPASYVLETGTDASGSTPSVRLSSGTGNSRPSGNALNRAPANTGGSSAGSASSPDSDSGQNGAGSGSGSTSGENTASGDSQTPGKEPEPETPSAPEYNNDYQEKTPEQPADIYENIMLPVHPMPEEGLEPPENPEGNPAELSVNVLTTSFDADLIYYGETLDAWKLLCACNVHLRYQDNLYRITALSDNFQITGFPEKAEENFTATFSFRFNANSPWIQKEVEFEVYPYKIILSDYNHSDFINEKSMQYPEEQQAVSLLSNYAKMYHADHSAPAIGESIDTLFLGWSENNGGKPIYYTYTPQQKGLHVLYPLGTARLPDVYTAEITAMWDDLSGYCFVQTLTGYTGTSRNLLIPEGIQTIAMTADADQVSIPASVLDIADTLTVKEAYHVDADNPFFSDRDGVLYDKACTALYAIPYGNTSAVIPETVEKIELQENNQIQQLTLESENPPEIALRHLNDATIYVPDEAYFQYVKKWAMRLGSNRLARISDQKQTDFYTQDDAILMQTDGETVLCGVTEQVKGIFTVPEGVTEIREDAFTGCSLEMLILPSSLRKLDSSALNGLENTRIYFTGAAAPDALADSFPEAAEALFIPESYADAYLRAWDGYGLSLTADTYAICETADGYRYFQEQDGATLLQAPEQVVHFQADCLPEVSLKAIGSYAFQNCTSLLTVELPEETKRLLPNAFYGCSNLELLMCLSPDTLYIGENAFDNCGMLYCVACNAASAGMENDYEPGNNCYFYRPFDSAGYASCFNEFITSYRMTSDGNGVFSIYGCFDDQNLLMAVTSNVSGSYVLEDNTVEIAPGAFSRCYQPFTLDADSFRSVMFLDDSAFENSAVSGTLTLSESFWLMGSRAFQNCTGLTGIRFETGENFTTIPANAFSGCTALEEVTFGENSRIASVCENAFEKTALQTFTFPETVTGIYCNIFSGCDHLQEIGFAGAVPPEMVLYGQNSSFVFYMGTDDSVNSIPLTVPEAQREAYFDAWKYSYSGFSDLAAMCNYYYMLSLWDDTTPEETAQNIYTVLLDKQQELWTLLQCDGAPPEPDMEEILEQLTQAEEDTTQW